MGSQAQPENAMSASGPPENGHGAERMTSAETRPTVARTDGGAERFGQVLRTPSVGATITGTVVLGAATLFGVLETTVAAGAAYVAYRLFKKKHLHGREKEE